MQWDEYFRKRSNIKIIDTIGLDNFMKYKFILKISIKNRNFNSLITYLLCYSKKQDTH